jgi:hypothetical protein
VDPFPDLLLFFLVVPGIEPGPPDVYKYEEERFHSMAPKLVFIGTRILEKSRG